MGSSEAGSHSRRRVGNDDLDNSDEQHSRKKERGDTGREDRREREHRRDRDGHDSDRRRRTRSPDTKRRLSRERDHDRDDDRRSKARREERHSSRDRDRDRHGRDRSEDRHKSRRRRGSRDGHRSHRSGRDDKADQEKANKKAVEPYKRSGPLPSQNDFFAKVQAGEDPDEAKPKEQANFGNSGALAAASNSIIHADGTSITLKYSEPPEARKPSPKDEWKLFVFKDGNIVDTIDIGLRSCWLVGREIRVVDLPAEHESISKQHAVIQFRYVEKRNKFGDKIGKVKPYLIDLESANGTMLNKEKVPESRYLELRGNDMVQFGLSSREYVLIHPE